MTQTQHSSTFLDMTTVSITLEVQVDDHAWADTYGAGDGYDRAEAHARRSLVADVRSYVLNAIQESPARHEGAIVDVDIAS